MTGLAGRIPDFLTFFGQKSFLPHSRPLISLWLIFFPIHNLRLHIPRLHIVNTPPQYSSVEVCEDILRSFNQREYLPFWVPIFSFSNPNLNFSCPFFSFDYLNQLSGTKMVGSTLFRKSFSARFNVKYETLIDCLFFCKIWLIQVYFSLFTILKLFS